MPRREKDMAENRNCSAQGRPLDQAWWEQIDTDWPPRGAGPLLAPYEDTRPGFELLAPHASFDQFFPIKEGGYHRVCLWDIWDQDDHKDETDAEKLQLNQMQMVLGRLDDETRYVRLQIACLQRCWWEFPSNVDVILAGIGSGQVNLDAGISCEPPWASFLGVLRHRRCHPGAQERGYDWRYHSAATNYDPLHAPRQELARAYMTILMWWTYGGDLSCLKRELPGHADLAETIYRRLGPPTALKVLYVGKVSAAIGWQAFPVFRLGDSQAEELVRAHDDAICKALSGREDPIGRIIGTENLCSSTFFRHIDHQLANIAAGQFVPLPGSGKERERIHGAVTDYVHVLGSWLIRRTLKDAVRIWPSCEGIAQHVYSALKEPTPVARWLVACLWKKLRQNQAEHGRGALDSQPERFTVPLDALGT